ncbi:hypothetical protein TIFTF001_012527 [Ficus carica]|uniref:Uncharacterized protein n=1 Tax=Ficus carica TaxID=3494 RepID=A0AA88A058_FICCA|nr:hypothetical protein TIFTF001_012527 [Ficus carica]
MASLGQGFAPNDGGLLVEVVASASDVDSGGACVSHSAI